MYQHSVVDYSSVEGSDTKQCFRWVRGRDKIENKYSKRLILAINFLTGRAGVEQRLRPRPHETLL